MPSHARKQVVRLTLKGHLGYRTPVEPSRFSYACSPCAAARDRVVAMSSGIMAIAAHPGDALFSMGAAVARHIHNGGPGVFLCLSLGEKGHRTIAPAEYGEMQRAATLKAAKILGAQAEFLTYPDAEIPSGDRIALEVC
ncbi:MAG: PIG-L family deacetylase, partial [Acidobacteria bacterium]|nr:PIG-L family deacetylase [Acidobacteriota bacterium]